MKFIKFLCWVMIVTGFVFFFLPYHMEFTGYVLVLLGGGLLLCTWLLRKGLKLLLIVLSAAMILGTVWLTGSVGVIGFYGSYDAALPGSDYAVILGAEIRGSEPSAILKERLDRGLTFMEENPDVIIIVSGGQGDTEEKPESQVMYDYLASQGADMSRVYQEDRSRNTRENLQYSGELAQSLGLDRAKVTIITSDFHLLRAEYIASSLDMTPGGIAAKTEALFFRLNYYLRESFSFVKAYVQASLNQ